MKLITFKKNTCICAGILTYKGVINLTSRFQSVKHVITGGPEAIKKARSIVAEYTIGKLGTLTNTLGQKPQEFYEPLTQ